MNIPPITATASFYLPPGAASSVTVPPVTAVIRIRKPFPGFLVPTPVPPLTIHIGILEPSFWSGALTLSSPQADAVIATQYPSFTVAVDINDEESYILEVQYATTSTFDTPTSLSAAFTGVDGGAILTATSPVTGTVFWRARILDLTSQPLSSWSETLEFTVDSTSIPAQLPVTWTVETNGPRPVHVWHTYPQGPEVGDTITIYGHGFNDPGHLTFGGATLPYQSWEYVAASTENGGNATRVISGNVVTPEHFEVTFTAPYETEGTLLVVED